MLGTRKYLVLVVEPDPAMRRDIREGLTADGFRVVDIPSVNEARRTAKVVQFDLLITDPFLPFVLDLARSLAKANPRQKVLFLSEYSLDKVRDLNICPSDSLLLQKPIARWALSEGVKACLSGETTRHGMASTWRDIVGRQPMPEANPESADFSEMA